MNNKRMCEFAAYLAGKHFCKYCGLYNLKNDATRKEIAKGCKWWKESK